MLHHAQSCPFLSCLPSPASFVAQTVKNLPAMQETQVQSLGREDPLEKGMATHSTTLARRIPWTEEPSGLQSMGSQRVRCDWLTFSLWANVLAVCDRLQSDCPILLKWSASAYFLVLVPISFFFSALMDFVGQQGWLGGRETGWMEGECET